jgi:predicted transcriptional regulator
MPDGVSPDDGRVEFGFGPTFRLAQSPFARYRATTPGELGYQRERLERLTERLEGPAWERAFEIAHAIQQLADASPVDLEMVASFNDEIAYTTLMTTLDRLYKKGYLERRKVDRAFVYKALHTPEELQRGITGDVITGLIDGATRNAQPVLACIVDAVSEKDRELLDELERLIKEKKESLKAK